MSRRNGKDGGRRPPSVRVDHEPPYNLAVEQAVLGRILYDPDIMHEVAVLTAPDEFWRDVHRMIARAIWDLYLDGKPCDGLSVSNELQRRGELDDVGGDDYLAELAQMVPSAANGPYLAQVVRQKHIARRTIEVCHSVSHRGYAGDLTADQLLELAESEIFAISDARAETNLSPIGPAVVATVKRIADRPDTVAGLSTGRRSIDDMLDGLHPGQLIIIGARPSMGKTALAMNFADHAGVNLKVPLLFVSLEMNRGELAERLLSSRTGIDNRALRRPGRLGYEQIRRIGEVEAELADVPFHVDDTPSRSALHVAAAARRLKARGGLGLVVVDYLQLVDGEDARDSREEKVAKLSRRFKVLARELGVPVLLMSQLNRLVETRGDRRPMMSDLRESGAIEQDADVVLLLHRPEYYDPKDQPGIAELIVAKNRNGETGTITLAWRKTVGRFEDLARHAERLDGNDF